MFLNGNGEILGVEALGVLLSDGLNPSAICFDDQNIWVANAASTSVDVAKLRASDGSLVGTYAWAPARTASALTAKISGWPTIAAPTMLPSFERARVAAPN